MSQTQAPYARFAPPLNLHSQLQKGRSGRDLKNKGFHPECTEPVKRRGPLSDGKLPGQLLLSFVLPPYRGQLFDSALNGLKV
ncbi:hypothetical protein D3C85_1639540 [compost metagenome]